VTWFWILFGAVLVGAVIRASFSSVVRWAVRRRLGGFTHRYNHVDPNLPLEPRDTRRVAVIGGGLAGVSAAFHLGERGFAVTLLEREPYLGGKVGSWTTTGPEGEQLPVSHGFHAFFRHYYNLNRFLRRHGIRQGFRSIDDYMIVRPDGDHLGFGEMEPTPLLNLLSLHKSGFFRWRDILFSSARNHMNVFFQYEPESIFRKFDDEPFDRYAARTGLPDRLRLAFNNFSRAFFADESKLSTAELLKSIHFYYFGHDHGLVYDYPTEDFAKSLWKPVQERLDDLGVQVRLECPVKSLERSAVGTWNVNGDSFDYVVLAADVAGARPLLEPLKPPVSLESIQPGQPYASVRMWVDRDARNMTPPFVITDRVHALDAVAFYHRMESEAADWVRANGGAVIELHCYAAPDHLTEDDEALVDTMKKELERFFPELEGYRVRHQTQYVARNFTAFHAGLGRNRPGTDVGLHNLFVAGDWVKLPFPAMLMEAAFSSGLLAANAIFSKEGLRQEPVDTVPPVGLMVSRARSNRSLEPSSARSGTRRAPSEA
jgi:isorenieratene synthase